MGTYLDQTELYLFNEGKSAYAYRALGCHRVTMEDGGAAYRFAVWAPNALSVSVVGSFNNWDVSQEPRCTSYMLTGLVCIFAPLYGLCRI